MKGMMESVQLGMVNGNTVFLRIMERFEADFHVHDSTDEMFYVISGEMVVDLPGHSVTLSEGESCTAPSGTRHRARVSVSAKAIVISRGLNA